MSNPNSHKNAPLGQVHKIHNWEFANSTARLAYTYTAEDLDKVAKDLDTGLYSILKTVSLLGVGTWHELLDSSSPSIVGLGETSTTAYRGDRGKTAYDHSQIITGNPHGSTTADISDTTNKRYVTDANLTLLNNTSGTNTGDETTSTIKSKLGITTLSGENTGDQDLFGLVPKTYTVNSKALSGNITLNATDIGLGNVTNTDCTNASNITSGTIAIERLPPSALERLYKYTGAQTSPENFGLTNSNVQNGDTVKIVNGSNVNNGYMWLVLNDSALSTLSSFEPYSVGSAASVPYSGVTSFPTNLSEIGSSTFSNDDIIQKKAGVLTNRSIAQLKTDLSLAGSNSGDQDLSGLVPKTYTVNGHALSGNISVTATDLSLGNVDNTSDVNKPISSATQTALNLKSDLSSPTFTGTPSAPTAIAGNSSTQIATTAFVSDATSASNLLTAIKTVDGSGSGLDADLLDGYDSTVFLKSIDYTQTFLFLGA